MICDVCGKEAVRPKKITITVGQMRQEINFCRNCDEEAIELQAYDQALQIGTIGGRYRKLRRRRILQDPRMGELMGKLDEFSYDVISNILLSGLSSSVYKSVLHEQRPVQRQTIKMIVNGNPKNLIGLEEVILNEIEEALDRGELP